MEFGDHNSDRCSQNKLAEYAINAIRFSGSVHMVLSGIFLYLENRL